MPVSASAVPAKPASKLNPMNRTKQGFKATGQISYRHQSTISDDHYTRKSNRDSLQKSTDAACRLSLRCLNPGPPSRADRNHDGVLDLEELASFVQSVSQAESDQR
jgi:hypothetical protein